MRHNGGTKSHLFQLFFNADSIVPYLFQLFSPLSAETRRTTGELSFIFLNCLYAESRSPAILPSCLFRALLSAAAQPPPRCRFRAFRVPFNTAAS